MLEIDNSYFDGGLLQLIGYHILGSVITTLTLGICLPWAYCLIYEWEAKHTVIEGRRLCLCAQRRTFLTGASPESAR